MSNNWLRSKEMPIKLVHLGRNRSEEPSLYASAFMLELAGQQVHKPRHDMREAPYGRFNSTNLVGSHRPVVFGVLRELDQRIQERNDQQRFARLAAD